MTVSDCNDGDEKLESMREEEEARGRKGEISTGRENASVLFLITANLVGGIREQADSASATSNSHDYATVSPSIVQVVLIWYLPLNSINRPFFSSSQSSSALLIVRLRLASMQTMQTAYRVDKQSNYTVVSLIRIGETSGSPD
jgi:hypothetical protein